MFTTLTRIALFVLPLITIVIAQSAPNFPDAPSQAPIGGLGLLAAAGGALAIKKLLDKHKK